MDGIYLRQQGLDLRIPRKVAVCGLGGIGSWVALNLALVGVPELVLIDPDALEPSNLNRTPYTPAQVGALKVRAAAALIAERRPDCILLLFPYMYHEVADLLPGIEWFLDCTDGLQVKRQAAGRGWQYLKLGYDGFGFTFDAGPDLPWEEEPAGYRTVPGFVPTPQFLAALAVCAITAGPPNWPRLACGDIREVLRGAAG
ncbi:MAG: ThiF family adenylyltransferase [Desulfotomaculales bacterium]